MIVPDGSMVISPEGCRQFADTYIESFAKAWPDTPEANVCFVAFLDSLIASAQEARRATVELMEASR